MQQRRMLLYLSSLLVEILRIAEVVKVIGYIDVVLRMWLKDIVKLVDEVGQSCTLTARPRMLLHGQF